MCNRLIIFLLIIFFQVELKSQTIRGEVRDVRFNEPLTGASVVVEGTSTGVTTDFDGQFELKVKEMPISLVVSYLGYTDKRVEVQDAGEKLLIKLEENVITTAVVEVKGKRISEKQKAAPLTVESLDLIAIKETASDNFYDGLGTLKGVDLTAASLGFKIINTRGFNSTSPVRSLQLIDGVDNQAPGLNFSLGNFLGSSELDVLKVDLIVGASSAFYGPNAFNGVISMTTKSPFFHKGLSAEVKVGERNLVRTGFRWADAFTNKAGFEHIAYKINFEFLRADDWEADNYDPVTGSPVDKRNPGRYDAVNIYGDEYQRRNDLSSSQLWRFRGLGNWYRTGYREVDLVDYDTRNIKASAAVHFRTRPEMKEKSPELIYAFNLGQGTTVYQGDNRFSLKNILFYQNRLEFRKQDKYFIRFYTTSDDAGESYDPYFTALRLQELAKSNEEWSTNYRDYWRRVIEPKILALGYPKEEIVIIDGMPRLIIDEDAARSWLINYYDSLVYWHGQAEAIANKSGENSVSVEFYEPGTERFDSVFNQLISSRSNSEEGGTRFYDRSDLYHFQAEYKFEPNFLDYIKVGASSRLYTPDTDGTIFLDTGDVKITNFEFGFYSGIEKKLADNKLTINATARIDKNQNFNLLFTPAASLVYKPKPGNYLRLSFSSGVRNPTLSDQYLNLNVGRATLLGNLSGAQNLITVPSLLDYFNSPNLDPSKLEYFDIDPIRPERVKTGEIGYRTTLFNKLYVDAGYYYSVYNDFLGFKIGVDAEFGQGGLPLRTNVYRYAANSDSTVTTQGFSIGLNYYFAKYMALNGNYSWNRLNELFEDDPIIPAFNTPEHKFNIGVTGRDIPFTSGSAFGFNVNYKWIEGFLFEGSPQFTGFIPTYALLDAQVNLKVRSINTTFKLGASNLLNQMNFQTYGGPRIGRLAYFSINYEFKNN